MNADSSRTYAAQWSTSQRRMLDEFNDFDKEHPDFWDQFKFFTFAAIDSGRVRFSARVIWERMRWETEIDGGGTFKVNNNWCAYYSRKFMQTYPEYRGFFKIRERKYARPDHDYDWDKHNDDR